MFKRILAAAALVLLVATPAFAFHCPADMAKIDAALAENPKLSPEQLDEVKALRSEGETLHNEGNHAESVKVLAQAMKILDIK
jgi:hypothetical protein